MGLWNPWCLPLKPSLHHWAQKFKLQYPMITTLPCATSQLLSGPSSRSRAQPREWFASTARHGSN